MKKLSEYKDEEALDLLADIIEPVAFIFSDSEFIETLQENKLAAIELKPHCGKAPSKPPIAGPYFLFLDNTSWFFLVNLCSINSNTKNVINKYGNNFNVSIKASSKLSNMLFLLS